MNWEHTFSQVNFFSILQRKGDYNRPSDYCFISVTPSDVISWILHNSGQHWGSWEYLQVVKHRKSVTPLWDWTLDITFLTQTKYPVKGVFWRVLNWLQYVIQSVDLTVSASFLSPSRTPKVNIVLPLSSAWKDKADKRWSHVSTSHNRRNRGRARRAVEAGYRQKPWVMFFFFSSCNNRNYILTEQNQNASLHDRCPHNCQTLCVLIPNVILTYSMSTCSNNILSFPSLAVLISSLFLFWAYCLLYKSINESINI